MNRRIAVAVWAFAAACGAVGGGGRHADEAVRLAAPFTNSSLYEAMPIGTVWSFSEVTPDRSDWIAWEVVDRHADEVLLQVTRGGAEVSDRWVAFEDLLADHGVDAVHTVVDDLWHDLGWGPLWSRRYVERTVRHDGVVVEDEKIFAYGFPGPPIERIVREGGVEVLRWRKEPPMPSLWAETEPALGFRLPLPWSAEDLLGACGRGERLWMASYGPSGGAVPYWGGFRTDFRAPRRGRLRKRNMNATTGGPIPGLGRRFTSVRPSEFEVFSARDTTRAREWRRRGDADVPGWAYRTLHRFWAGPGQAVAMMVERFYADAYPCAAMDYAVFTEGEPLPSVVRWVSGPPMAMTWDGGFPVDPPHASLLP